MESLGVRRLGRSLAHPLCGVPCGRRGRHAASCLQGSFTGLQLERLPHCANGCQLSCASQARMCGILSSGKALFCSGLVEKYERRLARAPFVLTALSFGVPQPAAASSPVRIRTSITTQRWCSIH